ncbi:hypothetical protein BKI52_08610 [marine bacterium AO1-C]|nr:hypothetical protein BKI52_08610 [marine bacterium AO1-C]
MTSESILEELIDTLYTYASFDIASKSTSYYLLHNPLPAKLLKEKYAIDFIIEGAVSVSEGQLMISSRLLSTESDSILLRSKYTFNEVELASVLEKIAQEICQKITNDQDTPLPQSAKVSLSKSEEYYLKGLYHWNRYTHQELRTAIKYFKNAIQHDENFAQAYAAISDCYCVIGVMGFEIPNTAFQAAKSYTQKALRLNNKRSEVFASAALIDMYLDRDYDQAKVNLSQALLLNKASLKTHHIFAMYYLHTQDLASAEKHALFNIKQAPLHIPHFDMIAKIYLYKKEFKKGLNYVKKALLIDPTSIEMKELEGHFNLHLGNYEQAIECYQLCKANNPNNPLYYSNLAYVFSKSNYRLDGIQITEDMHQLEQAKKKSSTYHYAQSIIHLGQLNYTGFFKHINLAMAQGLGMFVGEIICNPIYNEIRKDKRFQALLAKLHLNLAQEPSSRSKLPASSLTLFTKTKERFTLDPQYLAYIESQGNYSKIYWFDQKILKNVLLRVPLSGLEKQLSNLAYIRRCHKSYIININEPLTISGNTKGYFFESNYFPIRIPISRSKANWFINEFKK